MLAWVLGVILMTYSVEEVVTPIAQEVRATVLADGVAEHLRASAVVYTPTVAILLKPPTLAPKSIVIPVTVSVPELVTKLNLPFSVAETPGPMVEFAPSVPLPRVVVGSIGVAGLPVGTVPAS